MSGAQRFNRLTPVILVDQVQPCLSFWTDRLGFENVAEVPGPDGKPQFVMVMRDGIEVMYQTWASVEAELGKSALSRGHSITLFIEVADLNQVDQGMAGVPRVVERHTTFYGMDEFTVRDYAGNLVTFAMKTAN